MSDVVAKSVISLELDTSHLQYDSARAELIYGQLFDRLQQAANIVPRIATNRAGKTEIKIDVDPRTTRAGMEVIDKIVKQYVTRLNTEARVTVGVDSKQVRSIGTALTALRDRIVYGTAIGLGQAFAFSISRGIERIVVAALKSPFKLVASALSAYHQQEAAETKLSKAIGATGGQAGKTQAEIVKTAKELEKLTGVADTTVIAMQGILAASKGLKGDNFDRATKAALDLAEVLGGDPVNKAEKLAKALQEPEKALEMLRDEGVSFTKTQQEVVKYFVKMNDIASAQGIILDAIESKYYGASDAAGTHADVMAKLTNEYQENLETLGKIISETDGALVPTIEAGISVLNAYTPVIAGTTNAMLALVTSLLDYSIEGDRANLTTEEAIQKASEWRAALIANWNVEGIIANAKRRLLQLGEVAAEAVKWNGLAARPPLDANGQRLDMQPGNRPAPNGDVLGPAGQALRDAANAQLKIIEDAAADIAQADIDAQDNKKKRLEDEAAQRRKDADARREAAEKRLADAAILAKKDQDQEAAAKDKKKRLKKEEAAEDKRLKEEERTRLKAQQDFEKSMGRDSLVGLHQRIQDAMYLRREEAKKKKQDTTAEKVKTKPSFAPEDPDKWAIPWVKQQEATAKKKQEQEEQALRDRDKREARFKADEAAEISLKSKEQLVAKEAVKAVEEKVQVQDIEAKAFDEKRAADEAALQAAIAEEEKKKQLAKDRDAAERKLVDDAIGMRMTPEQEKAFWDANKPAMDLNHSKAIDKIMGAEKQAAEKKAFDESGGPERARQEYEKQRKENEERRRRFSEGRTPEQQDNLRRMLEGMPPLSSAAPPGKRKRSFAPEGTATSFAPEGGDIKVTVKPEQKEVVTAITAQTTAIVKAFGKSGKLGA